MRKLKISSATKLVIKLLRLQREQQYSRIIKCCWFKEEAGIDITVEKLVAIHDSNKHYKGMYPYGISTVFFLCKPVGGSFKENNETIASDYFALEDLPELSEDKGSREQVEMCFKAYQDPYWEAEFE